MSPVDAFAWLPGSMPTRYLHVLEAWKHGSMEDEDASGDLPGLTSGSPPIGASEFSSSQEEPLIM